MDGIGRTGHQEHRTTDEYGNPVNQGGGVGNLDDYTTSGTGTGVTTAYGTTGGTPLGGGGYGHEAGQQHHAGGGVTGMLHRSGSSSSSSSEDDGMGGRRKKGIKDKIKEKLPGGHKNEQITSTTTPEAYGTGYEGEQVHEKKGVMEKIKDKFSGHND